MEGKLVDKKMKKYVKITCPSCHGSGIITHCFYDNDRQEAYESERECFYCGGDGTCGIWYESGKK